MFYGVSTLTATVNVKLPRSLVERLEREARKAGLSFEEYLLELALRDLDPSERIREYLEASKSLLEQAREELGKDNVRQAAEKLWGVAALVVKAYAEWRDKKRLTNHGELWEYMRKLKNELGDWVYDSWMSANGMHICFYEGWCGKEDVEDAIKRIEKLLVEIEKLIKI